MSNDTTTFVEPSIVQGDARKLSLPDDSVDLVVTSPPYFGLRSYQDGQSPYRDQIGAEETPNEYLDNLITCTRETTRVLKPSGSLFINVGDKYSGAGRGNNVSSKLTNPPDVQGRRLRASSRRQHLGTEAARAKSLLGTPWRYALRCIDELGLILRAEIIWNKPAGMPESVRDRVQHRLHRPRRRTTAPALRPTLTPTALEWAARTGAEPDGSSSWLSALEDEQRKDLVRHEEPAPVWGLRCASADASIAGPALCEDDRYQYRSSAGRGRRHTWQVNSVNATLTAIWHQQDPTSGGSYANANPLRRAWCDATAFCVGSEGSCHAAGRMVQDLRAGSALQDWSEGKRRPTVACESERCQTGDGYFAPDDPPEMVFDIRIADGAEAERLRLEQARVLREVIEWVAQRRSESGPDRAA